MSEDQISLNLGAFLRTRNRSPTVFVKWDPPWDFIWQQLSLCITLKCKALFVSNYHRNYTNVSTACLKWMRILRFTILELWFQFHHRERSRESQSDWQILKSIKFFQRQPVLSLQKPLKIAETAWFTVSEWIQLLAAAFLLHQQEQSFGHGSWDCPQVKRSIQQFACRNPLLKVRKQISCIMFSVEIQSVLNNSCVTEKQTLYKIVSEVHFSPGL